ncbi:MAG: exodeoxyribonuclease VII large subunit, partial [Gammaproteobacteria bacterium]|nr:exodeoxyribonuclease VII large subunit [Gammaproteobacteria bacterium]
MEKPASEPVLTVSQLNREARLLLEQAFPALWVTGEISNLARPASGHLYFSLKDEQAQVRCALFRGAARSLRFLPDNGQQVLVRARIGLYEARGEYQLIIEHMEPAGDGLLLRRLEELKKRLAAEGLFDPARKRELPLLPRRIGVVTSPSGAAVRDILKILRRRFPSIPVVIYPTPVQGAAAKAEIVAALAAAAARAECDVLILARGGGSLEDLWCFNEESVVRAVAACPIPLVSGIGHETDFTLADLAADLRAPT